MVAKATHHDTILFKQDLQALSDELGIEIRVANFPPYTSKWNLYRTLSFSPYYSGVTEGNFKTTQLTKELIETTTTKAGLKVFATIFNRVYETGRKVANGFKESMRIVFDERLCLWNFIAVPASKD